MRTKTRQKSSAFWKHGKHKGALTHSINVNKEIEAKKKQPKEMKESVAELMKERKKK